jgi:hypothetical protein
MKLGICDAEHSHTAIRRLYDVQGADGPIRHVTTYLGFRHMLADSLAPLLTLLEESAEYGYRTVIILYPMSKWDQVLAPDVAATRVPHVDAVTVNRAGKELHWVAYDVFDPRFRDAYIAAARDAIGRVRSHRAVAAYSIGWAPDGEFGGEAPRALHAQSGRVIGKDEFMDAYRKLIDGVFEAATGQEVQLSVGFFYDGRNWQETWTMEVVRYALAAASKWKVLLRARQAGFVGYNMTIGLSTPSGASKPVGRAENPPSRYYDIQRSPTGEIIAVRATDTTIAGFFEAAVHAGYAIEGEDPGNPPRTAASAEDLARACEHLLTLNAGGKYPPGYTIYPKHIDLPGAIDVAKRFSA